MIFLCTIVSVWYAVWFWFQLDTRQHQKEIEKLLRRIEND